MSNVYVNEEEAEDGEGQREAEQYCTIGSCALC